jgi:hypothetical protein
LCVVCRYRFFDGEEENMRHVLKIAVLATFVSAGAVASVGSASAQELRFRIGPDRDRVERRVIERRVIRPAPRRTVCTTRWRDGRRVEVCRTEGRGPRW